MKHRWTIGNATSRSPTRSPATSVASTRPTAGHVHAEDDRRPRVRGHASPAPTYAELARNLGEPYIDAPARCATCSSPGRFLFAYGIFYPEGDEHVFEAKHIVFVGRRAHGVRLREARTGGSSQIRELGDFYLQGPVRRTARSTSRNYRTHARPRRATRSTSTRQETDTISRLVYGFASAYLLTGEDRFLEAAEKGTEYLREHMRVVDARRGHRLLVPRHRRPRRPRAEDASPRSSATTTTRSRPTSRSTRWPARPRPTASPATRASCSDIELTHQPVRPVLSSTASRAATSRTSTRSRSTRARESLGPNRARKNWNSVGDHAPAYLINLVAGDRRAEVRRLARSTPPTRSRSTSPTTTNSPFVQEKFHEDWSHDQHLGLAAEPRRSSATT